MAQTPGESTGASGLAWAVCWPLAWLAGVAVQLQQATLSRLAVHGLALLVAGLCICLALFGLRRVRRMAGLGQPRLASQARRACGWGTTVPCLPRASPSPGCWHDRVAPWAVLLALGLLGLGWASTGWRASQRLAERLPAALEGRDLLVTGRVVSLPLQGPQGQRFQLAVESAQDRTGRPVQLPSRLALGWYAGFDSLAWLEAPPPTLRGGQRWQLPVRLKQPHGAANPQGFDAELWWFVQGVGAQGHVRVVRGGWAPQRLPDDFGAPVLRLREVLRQAIADQVPDRRLAGVLAALVVGDQAAIDREDWALFRQTGIAHLVAISGVHVTLFAWLAASVVARAWRRWPQAMLWWPAPQAGRVFGVVLAGAYALLAGWGVPAQRTVCMLAVVAVLRAAPALWPWPLVLLAAAVAVTALDPWALMQPGFWLSFAAVGLLMASEPRDGQAPPRGWRAHGLAHLRGQVVATLGLAPLGLLFFQQVSLVGFLANLLAIPWVTLLVTPLALAGALLPGLWTLAAAAVQAMVWVLQGLAAWPAGVWLTAAAPAWAVALGGLAAAVAVLPLPWRLRALALPLVLPLLWPAVPRPAEGSLAVLAADVGQGTAVLLRTRQHALLYDTGPSWGPDSDAGQRLLLPLLQSLGVRQLDRLVLSHSDVDHVGGAESVLAQLPVRALLSSLPTDHRLLAEAAVRKADLQPCLAGQAWTWDGVRFEVLHPRPADLRADARPNSISCVLRVVDAAGRSLLLTGDIEAAQETALLSRLGPGLRSQLLLVPHHGSRTSSTAGFLAAVQPELAVVQAAYRSRFGHPAPDVVARIEAQGAKLVRTDRCGAWLWHDGAWSCTREVRRRYWHGSEPDPAPEAGSKLAEPVPGAPSR